MAQPKRLRVFSPSITRHWTLRPKGPMNTHFISMGLTPEGIMAHKKIERKKELDRRRHRRAERLKQRVREAKAAAKA